MLQMPQPLSFVQVAGQVGYHHTVRGAVAREEATSAYLEMSQAFFELGEKDMEERAREGERERERERKERVMSISIKR